MARSPSMKRLLAQLISKLQPTLRDAFTEAVRDMREGIDYPALVEALKENRIEAAIEALNIDASSFNEFRTAKTAAFQSGGALTAKNLPQPPGGSAVFRFDLANPSAEAWVKKNVGERITLLTEEQVSEARETILDGYQKGHHPEKIARSLAGTKDRVTGSRSGGSVGLSAPQQGYLRSMRERLESGQPGQLRRVLGMERRDRRFDRQINRAIESGEKLSPEVIERMVERYSERLLARRAEDIARTETGQAVMASRIEATEQGIKKQGYPDEVVIKRWRHGGGGKDPRVQHSAMSGIEVQGMRTPFRMPDGTLIQHPLDPAAPAKHTVNCTCDMDIDVDYSWGLA